MVTPRQLHLLPLHSFYHHLQPSVKAFEENYIGAHNGRKLTSLFIISHALPDHLNRMSAAYIRSRRLRLPKCDCLAAPVDVFDREPTYNSVLYWGD
ncbi:hypothetical protein TELCIR_18033 [Teladorsagia circumcincta]|uniref:Uncharacterized protein n=1 Tax=Teladorsagia circumcincta TaxID=45464 RepID=A0A2G9TR30_TELCI|nr:hypothetical protein TELCIR_18033 [Teladorsagia circumcincta]